MEGLNIEKVGPGAWYLIHTLAARSKSDEEIIAVHHVLRLVSLWFFCLRCREHFRKNMEEFPPPKVNKYNELFIWTVEMHNRVNILNDKPIVSYKDALDYYVGRESSCSGDCGSKKATSLPVSELILRVLTSGDRIKFNGAKSDSL